MQVMMSRMGVGAALLSLGLAAGSDAAPATLTYEAEAARLHAERVEVVSQESFPSKQGVSLRAGVSEALDQPQSEPDLVFTVKASEPGRYWIQTHAATDAKGTELMRQAKGKQQSMRLVMSVAGARPSRRVVFVPWSRPESCTQALGKYDLSGAEQDIRIWLPEGLRLDYIRISPYVPPAVPAAVSSYEPTVVPPPSRPRLWANAESLPGIRANLDQGENAPLWKQLQERAAKAFEFTPPADAAVGYNSPLEAAAMAKAFVFLMTGDRERGREAVVLMRDYLGAVEFDNLLDITREIGRAIYAGSLVYDWCYELMAPAERDILRAGLLRLADDMEIGWPPFRQMIVNGHGNEGQVNRDLLSMGIAIYDEDPVPYQYCAYRILEELVPMRAFEYQSPRHNQGVSYGPFRFGWDMHAATLFKRMTGKPVFHDNIGDVYKFWIYMRLPTSETLRDGDGFADGRPVNFGLTPLLCYAYNGDPIIKGDFIRQGGLRSDPMMILLLNDPNLQPVDSFASLPLTLDFGPVLGSMIARTGWNLGRNQSDVVVEMKGGGYNFGNHQHADAGSFQIYYRGLQAVDLGQYHFYGTPYDSGFCKRSVSHSMFFVVDPEETFPGTPANDGGARSVRSCPLTPKQTMEDPLFAAGTKVAADAGPSAQRPFFSLFSVDLTSAYSAKITRFVRTFCFLNLDNPDTPAALLILDDVTAANPAFRKYWQVNALNAPVPTAEGVLLSSEALGQSGQVAVHVLRPDAADRQIDILSGADANSVFGMAFTPPRPDRPEGQGHRVMVSSRTARGRDLFLHAMVMGADAAAAAVPVALREDDRAFTLTLADRVVVLNKTEAMLEQPLSVTVAGAGPMQVLLTGLRPGAWSIRSQDGQVRFNATVEAGRHTAFFVVPPGEYAVQPMALPGAAVYAAPADFMPALSPSLAGQVMLDGTLVTLPPTQRDGAVQLFPVTALLKLRGVEAQTTGDELRIDAAGRQAVFRAGQAEFTLNGQTWHLPVAARREQGEWFLPDGVVAALLGLDLIRDAGDAGANLVATRIPNAANLLWIEAQRGTDLQKLRDMLADVPGRTEYWDIEGENVGFEMALVAPQRLSGVGITWLKGSARQARFAIETSLDGVTWKKAYEGTSSGRSATMETYAFEPHEATRVRFRGFGNTENAWNSIVHFRLL